MLPEKTDRAPFTRLGDKKFKVEANFPKDSNLVRQVTLDPINDNPSGDEPQHDQWPALPIAIGV